MAAMHELKVRGFENFTNKDLVGALNAIGNAWSKFNAERKERAPSENQNKLRTVILQQIENQTQTVSPQTTQVVQITPIKKEAEAELDF
jgi:hypothetical protein